ncbi:hypothetical protein [Devosia aurantiaca]|uniref:DUF3828 domain-containing protein n=1 Tax=Devosia aurantiaca TaxID=2714858 RepID=A0A6M1SX55_9HYPH|nr:hypothetical protein [Devosia aurantiaca]NGP17421.1 hypothetical protein [Devosia aurantiaca]
MDWSLFGLVPMLFGMAPADSPRALLDAIYQPLQSGEVVNLEEHYSDHLQALIANNLELNAVDVTGAAIDPEAPGIVEFNPFLNGTDASLVNLSVTEPVVQGQSAVALVSFDTASVPTTLSISMINDGAWKIDDVASVGAGEKWLYSWLLQYDPYNQQ